MIMRFLGTCTPLCYCDFWKRLLLLACSVVITYAVSIWILGFHRCKYILNYRRPFSSCKANEVSPHIHLPCYNESEKEPLYMKWLIVDRLTRSRLMSLWNFLCTEFFIRTNNRLPETKVLKPWKWNYYSIIRKL